MNKKKIRELAEKIRTAENAKNPRISDLKGFFKAYLNTTHKSDREKLAENFKTRYLELRDFIDKNPEILELDEAFFAGSPAKIADRNVTNFFQILEEISNDL